MPRHRLAVDISSDLVFADADLEYEYKKQHTEAQKKLDIQFHCARSLAWAAVGLRMLKDSSASQHLPTWPALLVLIGAVTTLLPAFAQNLWPDNRSYVKYRPAVVLLDNILQVVLGCFTHENIYPEAALSWRTATPWRAVGVLATGSGVAWLNMSGLLGSLIFRYALPQQAALTIVMMLASPNMCARSFSLQLGHMRARAALLRAAGRVLPRGATAVVAQLLAQPLGMIPGSKEDAEYAYAACMSSQTVILLTLGFIAPTLYLFWREMQSRLQFASNWARRVPGVDAVALNPPPSLLQYWAFAAPAVATLYFYVARNMPM